MSVIHIEKPEFSLQSYFFLRGARVTFTKLILPFALALEANPINNINSTIIKIFLSLESVIHSLYSFTLNPRPNSHPVVSGWIYLAMDIISLFFFLRPLT